MSWFLNAPLANRVLTNGLSTFDTCACTHSRKSLNANCESIENLLVTNRETACTDRDKTRVVRIQVRVYDRRHSQNWSLIRETGDQIRIKLSMQFEWQKPILCTEQDSVCCLSLMWVIVKERQLSGIQELCAEAAGSCSVLKLWRRWPEGETKL